MSRSYSIYEAKAKLSALLRIVKNGHEVLVLERGTPIAKVVPFEEGETVQKRLRFLAENGLLVRGVKKMFPRGKKIKGGLKRFLDNR